MTNIFLSGQNKRRRRATALREALLKQQGEMILNWKKWKTSILWVSIWVVAFFVWWHFKYIPFFIAMLAVMILAFTLCIGTAYYPEQEWVDMPFKDAVQVCLSLFTPLMLLVTICVVSIELLSVDALNYDIPAENLTQIELWFRLTDLEEKKMKKEQGEVEKEEEHTPTRLEQVKEFEKELELD